MVSLNPNPHEGFYSDSSAMVMASFSAPAVVVVPPSVNSSSADDASKKIRKPYTITKSRESWTDPEHDKFLEALQLFDRDWKKIEAFIGSKTVIQIRSHAQKYFLKVQKSGINEHLPPPRPKRKAAHPYPQKAARNAPAISQVTASFKTSPALSEPGYVRGTNPCTLVMNPVSDAAVCSRTHNSMDFGSLPRMAKDDRTPGGQPAATNCCSSNESGLKTRPTSETHEQRTHGLPLRVLPDFAQVYGFIGSVFDPSTSGHLQKLKKMDPIDVETVLLLMRNLSINLSSPDFEDHRQLLSTYEVDSEKENSDDVIDTLLDCQSGQDFSHLGT
ncbi:protein REVEILLE 6-like [Cynara cardunculus var. scolymus]|uniref:protein REVEILLE 6-like n=1 Tax=Cynara cardunculus var. scolymus TaxID=59895 RepID=UPI000D62CBA6|nr:protein REVEILLE 6-like [Cynara cardunculus var. scolymus]